MPAKTVLRWVLAWFSLGIAPSLFFCYPAYTGVSVTASSPEGASRE